MLNIKFYYFSKSSFNFSAFSEFITNNFQIRSKYCLFLKVRSFKKKLFFRSSGPLYLEVLSFNNLESIRPLFNDLCKSLEKTELEEYDLLYKSYYKGNNMICIQYVEVTKNFDELNFEKLAAEDLPSLKVLDALKHRFSKYG